MKTPLPKLGHRPPLSQDEDTKNYQLAVVESTWKELKAIGNDEMRKKMDKVASRRRDKRKEGKK